MPDEWSFSLRSGQYYDSDSDDDERSPSGNPDQNHAGKETGGIPLAPAEPNALCDFDLSLRKDAAVYKPNPFSIAKINAACRAAKQPQKQTPRRTTPPSKHAEPSRRPTSSAMTKGVACDGVKAVRFTLSIWLRPWTPHVRLEILLFADNIE
jgi:hypothetical protein